MLVTVATLFDGEMMEHWVAVVQGKISEQDRWAMASKYNAVVWTPPCQGDEERVMYFREMETCKSWEDVSIMGNIESS